MSRIAIALLVASALAGFDDKIGKMKAPEALTRSRAAWLKRKGAHVKVTIVSPMVSKDGRGEGTASFEGKLLRAPEFAALRGACEAYCKIGETLVKTAEGEFQDPVKFEGEENRIAAAIRNPSTTLAEVYQFLMTAAFAGDEKLEALDCKVAETAADEKTTLKQIAEISTRVNSPWRKWVKDIAAFCDRKKSASTYRAWVNKEDFSVAKIEWTLLIVFDKKSMPWGGEHLPDEIKHVWKVEFSNFDKDLEIEIPAGVKKIWKIQ